MFLMQLGRIAESQSALGRSVSLPNLYLGPEAKVRSHSKRSQYAEKLVDEIKETFSKLLDDAVMNPKIY